MNGTTILVHSASSVVLNVLLSLPAAQFNVLLTDVATHDAPFVRALEAANIPVQLAPHEAVAFYMDTQVDLVLVGAEAIVENGGVLNKIGRKK